MTENAIRHYFTDFPTWCAIKNITEPKHDDVIDWAAELVMDNFISEEEAAELAAAAKENKDLYAVPSLSGDATVAAGSENPEKGKKKDSESASTLGVSPMPGLKKSIESFADKASAAVKSVYDSNSVMMEDCEQDILDLNNAIATMRRCAEKASGALESMGKAMSYQKNEDTMKAISLLGDAIKELAGSEGEGGEEEAGAPADSLSSEVSAIYNEEPVAPNDLPNPAGGEGGENPNELPNPAEA